MATTKATNLGHRSDVTLKGTTTTIETDVVVSDTTTINNAGDDVGLKINSTSTGHIMQLQDGGTDVMVVKDGGNVGIGCSDPNVASFQSGSKVLSIEGDGADDFGVLELRSNDVTSANRIGEIRFVNKDGGSSAVAQAGIRVFRDGADDATAMGFYTEKTGGNFTEKMQINSSGAVLIDKTSSDANTVGFETSSGTSILTADDAKPLIVNRKTGDDVTLEFRKNNTIFGHIQPRPGVIGLEIHSPSNGKLVRAGTASVQWHGSYFAPAGDNAQTLGIAGNRWNVVYAVDDVINTSDFNEKQDIEEISEAEKRVAVACKSLIRKFRFKDAVKKKGDEARIHFGIIAQDLKSAFEAEGLVAERYAMFCKDVWYEHEGETYTTEEEAPEGATKKELLGVRYSELFAFIISAI